MTDSTNRIKSVTIVGGGTAGWMMAAGLSSLLADLGLTINLIESDQIGTVGVGEATLPHIRFFNKRLGIDENDLMAATQATYKLGIEFKDWGKIGDSYIHPFGDYGRPYNGVDFHHYFTRYKKRNIAAHIDNFSVPVVIARQKKFQTPKTDPSNLLSQFGYAYQFDAGLYAKYLRQHCEDRGVTRIEGKVQQVKQDDQSGNIKSVILESGQEIGGDLFIDCSGFRGLLISKTLNIPYRDWTNYLPCNSAVTATCKMTGPTLPYTRATAKSAGWQWRIPLQHRVGNGYVYSSEFMDADTAEESMLADLETEPTSSPRHLKFVTGQRQKAWVKNCIAVGLSGGFLEPLESTGIYLIQEAITNFIELFPVDLDFSIEQTEYNRIMDVEFERVRDFLLLHYVATNRDDSPFWKHLTTMPLPDSLTHKMDLFKSSGKVINYDIGAFKEPSWLAVYYGQNVIPESSDPLSHILSDSELDTHFKGQVKDIQDAVQAMESHDSFIDKNCRA